MKLFIEKLNENKYDFIQIISEYYPLKEAQLDKYIAALDWEWVARNKRVVWTNELIQKYLDQLGDELLFVDRII